MVLKGPYLEGIRTKSLNSPKLLQPLALLVTETECASFQWLLL